MLFLEQITLIVVIMGFVALFFNTFGLIAFYSFSKQRKFPASVLAWIAVFNILWAIYELTKWVPGTKANKAAIHDLLPADRLCQFIIFVDNFLFYSSVGTNTLIAITLYLCVCKHVSMKYKENPRYFYGYVIGLFLWISIVPITVSFLPRVALLGFACSPEGLSVIGILVPCYVMIAVQMCLIIPAFARSRSIVRAIKSKDRTDRDVRLAIMYLRYVLTLFSQLLYFLPHNSSLLHIQATGQKAPNNITIFTVTCYCMGMVLDGMILTFTNRSLWEWVRIRVFKKQPVTVAAGGESPFLSGASPDVTPKLGARMSTQYARASILLQPLDQPVAQGVNNV